MTDNITLPRATVEQVLEALENWRKGPHDSVTRRGNTTRSEVAIAFLRAALAQPSPATLIDPRGSLGEPIV